MQHTFADGKYTVINDNGKLTALRPGEHWGGRDLCGDNLVYWMFIDYDKMKEQRNELLDALKTIVEAEGAEQDEWDGVERVIPEMCKVAKGAIAKATNNS